MRAGNSRCDEKGQGHGRAGRRWRIGAKQGDAGRLPFWPRGILPRGEQRQRFHFLSHGGVVAVVAMAVVRGSPSRTRTQVDAGCAGEPVDEEMKASEDAFQKREREARGKGDTSKKEREEPLARYTRARSEGKS